MPDETSIAKETEKKTSDAPATVLTLILAPLIASYSLDVLLSLVSSVTDIPSRKKLSQLYEFCFFTMQILMMSAV